MGLSNTGNQESVRGVSNLQIGMDDTPDKNISIEDLLKSKNSKIPSGQTGDTAYFTATSAEIEEAKYRRKQDIKRQNRQSNSNIVTAGLIIISVTFVVALIINGLACRCSASYCQGSGLCQLLILIFSIPLFLTGVILMIAGTISKHSKNKRNIDRNGSNVRGQYSFLSSLRLACGFVFLVLGILFTFFFVYLARFTSNLEIALALLFFALSAVFFIAGKNKTKKK